MRLTHVGGKQDRIDPECVDDLQKQIDYLGSLNFVTYYNRQQFVVNEFGEKRIEKLSTIQAIQADQYRPTWIKASVQKDMLNDEIEVLQWGQ